MRVVRLTSLIAGTSVALLATPLAASSAIPASPGNRSSYAPDISSRFVVFASDATNLVAGDTNGKRDIFLRDMVTKSTRLVSKVGTKLANAHNYSPAVSDDGRYVAFLSDASNLVTGDTNGKTDAFRADLPSGEIVRVSTGNAGQQGNGITTGVNMSANGAIISFDSTSTNLVTGDRNKSEDVFRRDFSSGQFSRLSGATTVGYRRGSSLSPNGNVAAWGATTNDSNSAVWQWNKSTGKTALVVQGWDDMDGSSGPVAIRASNAGTSFAESNYPGSYITGVSKANPPSMSTGWGSNLMYGEEWDVSAWGVMTVAWGEWDSPPDTLSAFGYNVRKSLPVAGSVLAAAISGDGSTVAFIDQRSNPQQVRVWKWSTGTVTVASTS